MSESARQFVLNNIPTMEARKREIDLVIKNYDIPNKAEIVEFIRLVLESSKIQDYLVEAKRLVS